MKQILIIVVCVILILVAVLAMIYTIIHMKKEKYRQWNKKIAVFNGKMVNKKAEGTMGYGLLFGEGTDGDTVVTSFRSTPTGQIAGNCTFKYLSTGETVRVPFSYQLIIGREKQQNVPCFTINSRDVSRRHCQLYVKENKIYVQDLGSQNHTYLNGKIVSHGTQIRSGDVLGLGFTEVQVLF